MKNYVFGLFVLLVFAFMFPARASAEHCSILVPETATCTFGACHQTVSYDICELVTGGGNGVNCLTFSVHVPCCNRMVIGDRALSFCRGTEITTSNQSISPTVVYFPSSHGGYVSLATPVACGT